MDPIFSSPPVIPNQKVLETPDGISLHVKREDLLHAEVSGNKFRKLKYNLQEAVRQGKTSLLTFGGAYSNHIAASAAAGKLYGMQTIGIIRGEELGRELSKTLQENATLKFAAKNGMKLGFLSREDYRRKTSEEILGRLRAEYGDFYLVPEGGTNEFAIEGCQEILTEEDKEFDIICCAVGTGGTISGLINSAGPDQRVLGFPALKGDFLREEISKWTNKKNWELILTYHFGGYAKVNRELVEFMNSFRRDYNIPLDPVYTGKMMYGVFDLLQKGAFSKNTRILAIHTGGLQGIPAMNSLLIKKNLPPII